MRTNRSSRASLSYAMGRSMEHSSDDRMNGYSVILAEPDGRGNQGRATCLDAARHEECLPAHVVAVRAAEQVDRPGRLCWGTPAAERDRLVHRGDARTLHPDPHLAPVDFDGPRFALGE